MPLLALRLARLKVERDIHARILYVTISLRDFMTRQRGAAASAVRKNLVPAIKQILVVQRLERPPHTLYVVVRVRDVRIAVVEPVTDALAQLFPVGAVFPDTFAAKLVELLDADLFDLLLAGDAKLLLYFDLDGKAVSVPACLARNVKSAHRTMAAEQILDRPREDVMNSRASVRRRRPFEEHVGRHVGRRGLRVRK